LVEHAADADAVDMRGFDTESDDPARKDVHDNHHPEALQQDRLAPKKDRRSTGCHGLQRWQIAINVMAVFGAYHARS
jgi:hypothetical protein